MRRAWQVRFLSLAEHIADWSKDPSTKVGAVITDQDNRIVSVGFNGLPRNIEDKEERLNDRDLKYKMTVHAEMNAILFAQQSLAGCILYTWPMLPCARCAAVILQTDIMHVVAPYNNPERWAEDIALASLMFTEAGVLVTRVR